MSRKDDELFLQPTTRRQALSWLLYPLIRKGAEAVAPIVTTLAVVATDKTELSRRQFLQVVAASTALVNSETNREKEAMGKLKRIFDIQDRLEKAGKRGDNEDSAEYWNAALIGGLGIGETVKPRSFWIANKPNIEEAKNYIKKYPKRLEFTLNWLMDTKTAGELQPSDYLNFETESTNVDSTVSIEARGKNISPQDIAHARELVRGLELPGLKIVICDELDTSVDYPLRDQGENLAVMMPDGTMYVDRKALDKIPHEAFHWLEKIAYRLMSPEQLVETQRLESKLLLDSQSGRLYPQGIKEMAGLGEMPNLSGEYAKFRTRVNRYPLKFYLSGGKSTSKRLDIMNGAKLGADWSGVNIGPVNKFVEFTWAVGVKLRDLQAINTDNLFGKTLGAMADIISFDLNKDWSNGLASVLGSDLKFDDANRDASFKRVFERFTQRMIASWLWYGKEDILKSYFFSQEEIDAVKIRLGESMKQTDQEFLAETIKVVHLSRKGFKTDVPIPPEANKLYDYVLSAINSK